jgi:hypothetical protein
MSTSATTSRAAALHALRPDLDDQVARTAAWSRAALDAGLLELPCRGAARPAPTWWWGPSRSTTGPRTRRTSRRGGAPATTSATGTVMCTSAHRRVVRTGTIPVVTSARLRPRAAGGFADHLAGLA